MSRGASVCDGDMGVEIEGLARDQDRVFLEHCEYACYFGGPVCLSFLCFALA